MTKHTRGLGASYILFFFFFFPLKLLNITSTPFSSFSEMDVQKLIPDTRVSADAAGVLLLLAERKSVNSDAKAQALLKRRTRWSRHSIAQQQHCATHTDGTPSVHAKWIYRHGKAVTEPANIIGAQCTLQYEIESSRPRTEEEAAFVAKVMLWVEEGEGLVLSSLRQTPARMTHHIAAGLAERLRNSVGTSWDGALVCRVLRAMCALLASPHTSPRVNTLLSVCAYSVLSSHDGDIANETTWLSRDLAARAFVIPLRNVATPGAPLYDINVIDARQLEGEGEGQVQYSMIRLACGWGVAGVKRLLEGGVLQDFAEKRLGGCGAEVAWLKSAVFDATLLLRHSADLATKRQTEELLDSHGPSLSSPHNAIEKDFLWNPTHPSLYKSKPPQPRKFTFQMSNK